MKLTVKEVLETTKGTTHFQGEEVVINGVSTDSRNIQQGEMFVPLIGEQFDGHDYILNVEKKGAVASLWNRSKPIPKEITIPVIFVDDTLQSLQDLARYYRNKVNPKVVGITGSNGKTTTKDLIASILKTDFHIHKTQGNYNNHIGVPLTLLSMPENTKVAIIEMGMSHLGEIEVLTQIARPDLAVITNIGESHLEFLKTRENITLAKLEITKGLKENGVLILNGDEPLLRNVLKGMEHSFRLIWVGKNEQNNHRYPLNMVQEENEMRFTDSSGEPYQLPLYGSHNVMNALMAIEVGSQFGLSSSKIRNGLARPEMTSMRLEKVVAKNGSVLINDAYNASPTSMKASLQLLTTFTQYSKKMAILGDMYELGEYAEHYHKEIGTICSSLNLDLLITTGKFGQLIAKAALNSGMIQEQVCHFEDIERISPFILQHTDRNTIILIKASRGMHLERVVQQLLS
ncbi:UDP-N-acetylmuramoyl-tripeptide--D-alanyl-D-alanine ligase [Tepidibacillus marianensis]|uniref:UDP-N-acetylmuramoyl-tripeptide--D-alanyl-D- alanine ligase n=1 Tax=Tepidibacillus marianensis TaxID=3131995 RepID=UPI0030CD4B6E